MINRGRGQKFPNGIVLGKNQFHKLITGADTEFQKGGVPSNC